MSEQNWLTIEIADSERKLSVKLNRDVALRITQSGFVVGMKNDYPWLFAAGASCSACAPENCTHRALGKPFMPLHVFAWVQRNGLLKPDADGKLPVIHHRNEDKCDARLKNLVATTPAKHARIHNAKRRKYGRRKRIRLDGLYRPRLPASVKRIPVGQVHAVRPPASKVRPKSAFDRVVEVERLLEEVYEPIVIGTGYLEQNGKRIPRSASLKQWRSPKSRLLRLHAPRLACTAAEATFVRLYASWKLNLEDVAADLSVSVDLLRPLLKRVSVSEAIRNWLKYGRLPVKIAAHGYEEVRLQSSERRR